MHWWEIAAESAPVAPRPRAVAYYRHSAQDRQENSIPIQQDQVRQWATDNGVDIIHEFADAGKSGLNAEGRPAFTEMMEEWVKRRPDFEYILCLDVSRWGRFQDIDLSAQFSAECKKHRKQVIYTTIGKPRENDPLYPVYVQFERFRAAQYSKELSDKVWRGCVKISEQGYWAGGAPPYGLNRLLLDEKREPVNVLESGQRKSIQNQRVTLVQGDPEEVATIQRIFHEFVDLRHSEHKIAEGLQGDGVLSPGGHRWSAGMIVDRLRNEKYVGTMVYNKTTKKLKTPTRPNPPEQWVRTPEAFDGIVTLEQFVHAQELLARRRQKYQPEEMLAELAAIQKRYGLIRPSLVGLIDDGPSPATFAQRFMDAFDAGIVSTNNFAQARKIIVARMKAGRERRKTGEQISLDQLKQDIAAATKVKVSYVREAKGKETRFLTLLTGINVLWHDADLLAVLREEKLIERPELAGDFAYETPSI